MKYLFPKALIVKLRSTLSLLYFQSNLPTGNQGFRKKAAMLKLRQYQFSFSEWFYSTPSNGNNEKKLHNTQEQHQSSIRTQVDWRTPTLRWLLHVSKISSTLPMFSSVMNSSVPPDSQGSRLVCLDLSTAAARDPLSEGGPPPEGPPPEDWPASSLTAGWGKGRQVYEGIA